MLIKILIGLAVIVVAFAIIVAMRPADFRIVRSTTIAAPPEAVFAQVNDLHQWQSWSPWEKLDPQMSRTFLGPPAGVGATYRWVGNKKAGEGVMRIAESRPAYLVRLDLEFIKPFAANNVAEFKFEPEGGKTQVTWSMTGRNGFMGKAFCMVMDMDKMVGADFEKGLAAMKSVAESRAAASAPEHAAAR